MPYPKEWNPFEGSFTDDIDYDKQASMRLNFQKKPRRKPNRSKTGIDAVDKVLGGGLPEGVTVVYGPAGAGKSLFSKTVVKNFASRGKKCLYFFGEDSLDAPEINPPVIQAVDLVSYRPGPEKAVKTILKFVQKLKPDLVIIDSLTTILGGTSKAVPEADIREYTGELASRLSGVIPVIAISEVRSSGQYENPAGGRGVQHAGLACIYFGKILIENKFTAFDWHSAIGEIIYTMRVEKDRDGMALQGNIFRITYVEDFIFLEKVGSPEGNSES